MVLFSARQVFVFGSFVLASAFGVGCAHETGCPTCPTPTARTLVGLSVEVPSSIKAGTTTTLSARASYSDSTSEVVRSGVFWSTTDPKVLGVTAEGVASAIGKGTATVVANFKERAASAAITVVEASPVPSSASSTPVNIAGTWRLEISVSRNARGADCDMGFPLTYQAGFSQSGSSVTGIQLEAAQPGRRPLPLMSVTSQKVNGTVTGSTVALSMTFTEDNNVTSSGIFTGVLNGTTLQGSFNGNGRSSRSTTNCQAADHVMTFVR